MQYIVLDMEWNQPWPGSYAAQKVLPVQIHGEIIQIGAVRLLETGKIADEFQVLVRPKYYKKLNSRVSKLTGLRDARLREELARTQKEAAIVVVAQRIATIMHADQVIVLDDGQVVGQGTHEELLRSCPAYLEIAQSQLSAAELGLTDAEIAQVMEGGER